NHAVGYCPVGPELRRNQKVIVEFLRHWMREESRGAGELLLQRGIELASGRIFQAARCIVKEESFQTIILRSRQQSGVDFVARFVARKIMTEIELQLREDESGALLQIIG